MAAAAAALPPAPSPPPSWIDGLPPPPPRTAHARLPCLPGRVANAHALALFVMAAMSCLPPRPSPQRPAPADLLLLLCCYTQGYALSCTPVPHCPCPAALASAPAPAQRHGCRHPARPLPTPKEGYSQPQPEIGNPGTGTPAPPALYAPCGNFFKNTFPGKYPPGFDTPQKFYKQKSGRGSGQHRGGWGWFRWTPDRVARLPMQTYPRVPPLQSVAAPWCP
jgi:hypothetical protein